MLTFREHNNIQPGFKNQYLQKEKKFTPIRTLKNKKKHTFYRLYRMTIL